MPRSRLHAVFIASLLVGGCVTALPKPPQTVTGRRGIVHANPFIITPTSSALGKVFPDSESEPAPKKLDETGATLILLKQMVGASDKEPFRPSVPTCQPPNAKTASHYHLWPM